MIGKIIIVAGVALTLSLCNLQAQNGPGPKGNGQGGPAVKQDCPQDGPQGICDGTGPKGPGYGKGPGMGQGRGMGKGPGMGAGMGQGQGYRKGPAMGKGNGQRLRNGTGPNCPQ